MLLCFDLADRAAADAAFDRQALLAQSAPGSIFFDSVGHILLQSGDGGRMPQIIIFYPQVPYSGIFENVSRPPRAVKNREENENEEAYL